MRSGLSNSDLPVFDGRIYHLALAADELAPDILLVGDPGRADQIAKDHFDSIEHRAEHRGLVSITGRARLTGQRVSVVTSGMGTPSLEIVLNELYALNAIDLCTREPKLAPERLHVIRVGTSGALQDETPLGALIVTDYAVGLDNTGLFYEVTCPDAMAQELERRAATVLSQTMREGSRFTRAIVPYVSRADPDLTERLFVHAQASGLPTRRGVTVSNSGFFANQGRNISSVPLSVPDIDAAFAELETGIDGLKVENMEMEASFLLHFLAGIGARGGAICVGIANRRRDTFAEGWREAVSMATTIALQSLADLRR